MTIAIQSAPDAASIRLRTCYDLQRTANVLVQELAQALKPFDLTPTQCNVLDLLREAENDGLTCREVREGMTSDDPDVTRMLDRLERRGLLVRKRAEDDRRVVRNVITDRALPLLNEVDTVVADVLSRRLGPLDDHRTYELLSLLGQIRELA